LFAKDGKNEYFCKLNRPMCGFAVMAARQWKRSWAAVENLRTGCG